MKYKIVPAPKIIEGTPDQAAKTIEKLINENAVDGWEYHSMETIASIEKAGCLQKQGAPMAIYLLIFAHKD